MPKLTALLCSLLLILTIWIPALAQEDAADEDSDMTAAVRIGHFSPDAPHVDIYLDDDLVVEDLAFTQVTPFLAVSAGTYDVAIVATGNSIEDGAVGPIELTFSADTNTTVAAVGSFNEGSLMATIFTEDYDPLEDNRAGITFFHAIEDEGAINIIGSGTQLVDFLRYPDVDAGFDGAFTRPVPAGLYDLRVQVDSTGLIVRSADDVEFADGQYYLVVALGLVANDGDLLIVTPDGNLNEPLAEATAEPGDNSDAADAETEIGTAAVRIGHFSPDAPNVDIYVDGDLAIEDLAFTQVTPFLEVPAGTREVVVTATGDLIDDAVLGPLDVTLEADTNTTIGAIGSLENDSLSVTAFTENYGPLADGTARITVLHTIEDEREFDVFGSSVLLIQFLRYPNADLGADGAFTRDVPAGSYNLSVRLSDAGVTIRTATGVELDDGEYYLIVALGPQSDEGDLLVVPSGGNLDTEASD